MIEATTSPATKRAFHRAHEERARALREFLSWVTGSRSKR